MATRLTLRTFKHKKRKVTNVSLCRWALRQRFAVSRRCVCMMVPINGRRTNYVYMIDCTRGLYVINATHNPSRMASHNFYRRGLVIYLSFRKSENLSRLLFIFQTANHKVHDCLPYSAAALSRSFCRTNSVSHI